MARNAHESAKKISPIAKKYDYTYVRGRKYETTYKTHLVDNKPKKLPDVAISPVNHLIQGFNFILTLNNFTYGFKEISGFRIERQTEPIQEGGVNDHQLIVGAPSRDTPTLECRRGLMIRCNPAINNAARAAAASIPSNLGRKAALMAANSWDPQATLEQGPAIGTIEVYDRNKRLCAMYTFLSLGMVSWDCDSLDADNNSVLIETLSIAHTGLTRVPLGAPNTFFGYITEDDDSDVSKNANNEANKWADFNNRRAAYLAAQAQYLAEQAGLYSKQLQALSAARAAREEKLKKLKDAYKDIASKLKDSDKTAKEAAQNARDAAKSEAKAVEETKAAAAEENAAKAAAAKQKAESAKQQAAENRSQQISARQAELNRQKEIYEQKASERTGSDAAAKAAAQSASDAAKNEARAVEAAKTAAAEENAAKAEKAKAEAQAAKEKAEAAREEQVKARQQELDKQKEIYEKEASKRADSDEAAKESAEKARSAAKDEAEQIEAKKKGGSK